LSPFIHKYKKEVEEELNETNASFKDLKEKEEYIYKKTYKYVLQQMQNFIF
jgi:ribonucleoside-triphosphate reductase (formate)